MIRYRQVFDAGNVQSNLLVSVYREFEMIRSTSRRHALVGIGAAVVGATILKACGGGSGSDANPSDPSTPSTPSSGMTGSIWYSNINRDKILKVSQGGFGTPVEVADIRRADGRVSTFYPRISRNSPRYLQIGSYGASSDVGTLMQVYEHSNHQPYCYFDAVGYASDVLVSPSGNYIGLRRSPEFINSDFAPDASTIIGLTILDISNPNNIGVVRSDFLNAGDAVVWFAWLDGDRFVYVDKNRNIVGGTAGGSPASDRVIGRLDTLGLLSTGWDVHPDGNSMLVTSMVLDGSSWDIYLHDASGRQLDRVTTSGKAYAPEWAPDGRHFMFKWGNSEGCGPVGGCSGGPSTTCTGFHAPAGSRNLAYEGAQQLDGLKVPCLSELYWSSIP